MPNLDFLAGGMSPDSSNPPVFDTGSVEFAADGNPHTGGWSMYVPPSLVAVALTIRFYFIDNGAGAGAVPLTVQYFAATETTITTAGSATLTITVPNVLGTIYSEDLDITGWIPTGSSLFLLTLTRDSSAPADTFAGALPYFAGKTL